MFRYIIILPIENFYCKQEVVAGPWLPSKKTKRPNLLDAEISFTKIKKCSFCSKNNKSTGTDQINAEILKACFDIVSPFF